jgi:hypothetical protein
MVAANQVDAVRVTEFEANEEGDGFDAEEAAVDIVSYTKSWNQSPDNPVSLSNIPPTEEKVVGVGAEAADPKYLDHVEKLPMDISNDSDRSRNVDDIALLHQQLFGLRAYRLYHRVRQKLLLVEPRYTLIKINGSYNNKSASQSGQLQKSSYLVGLAWSSLWRLAPGMFKGGVEEYLKIIVMESDNRNQRNT